MFLFNNREDNGPFATVVMVAIATGDIMAMQIAKEIVSLSRDFTYPSTDYTMSHVLV